MSRVALERFLFRFDKDPSLRKAFERGDFSDWDLGKDEIAVLVERDLATLYQWGVHPLLIRNYGATVGVRYLDSYAERGLLSPPAGHRGDHRRQPAPQTKQQRKTSKNKV